MNELNQDKVGAYQTIKRNLARYGYDSPMIEQRLKAAETAPDSQVVDTYNDLVDKYNSEGSRQGLITTAQDLLDYYNVHTNELADRSPHMAKLQQMQDENIKRSNWYKTFAEAIENNDRETAIKAALELKQSYIEWDQDTAEIDAWLEQAQGTPTKGVVDGYNDVHQAFMQTTSWDGRLQAGNTYIEYVSSHPELLEYSEDVREDNAYIKELIGGMQETREAVEFINDHN